MSESKRLPEPCKNQLTAFQDIYESDREPLLAVQLHKTKFDQQKAIEEYESNLPLEERLPGDVYKRSEGMVQIRGEDADVVSAEDAWTAIGDGEQWVGSLPVQMYRKQEDVYLQGYPYLIGFEDGEPRVVLNKILPDKSANMDRFYANEWARPWLIAEILDASGFTTDNLLVATMKAYENSTNSNETAILKYLYRNARQNVYSLLEAGKEVDRPPWKPIEPDIPHQSDYVRTQLINYRSDFDLFSRLGYGNSVRDAIELFHDNKDPRATVPPDRGLSLDYALNL